MNTVMLPRRWRRPSRRRAVSPILGTILILAMTIAVFAIVFSFRLVTPPNPPTANFAIRTGGSTPVWGDPTDCQPLGAWTYPLPGSETAAWNTGWWNNCEDFAEGTYPTPGNFSLLNTTQIIFSSMSSYSIPLTQLNFTFVCNGAYAPSPYTTSNDTVLVVGNLATMTWNPGLSTTVPVGAPLLGYCGGFDMGAEAGAAFGSEFDRLMIFVPITATQDGAPASILEVGDTIYLYIHNGGWPLDYACIEDGQPWGDDGSICPDGNVGHPLLDVDDFHGAPSWCFASPLACTIYITYTGSPGTVLAQIPVYSLAAAPN
jgi:flagellin-like protein